MQPSSKGENKVYIFCLGHMTKISPCPYMVKTLKNLLKNHGVDCLETWDVACGELVLWNLFKWWPWVNLGLIYGKVKFGPIGFWLEKVEKVHFLVAIVLFDTVGFQIQPLWNSRGQGLLVTLARGHMSVVCQHFQKASSLKLLGQFH